MHVWVKFHTREWDIAYICVGLDGLPRSMKKHDPFKVTHKMAHLDARKVKVA
jgi:hypothetical protein